MSLNVEIYQYQDFFWHFRTIKTPTQRKKSKNFKSNSLSRRKSFRLRPHSKIQLSGYGDNDLEYRKNVEKTSNSLAFSNYRNSTARNEVNAFQK